MPLLERTRNGPKLNDAGRTSGPPRGGGPGAARGGRARAEGDRRARGGRAADRELPERERHPPHRGAGASSAAGIPSVRLSVTEAEPEQSLPRLRAAEVDLAIVFDYPMLPSQADERDIERALLLTESDVPGAPERPSPGEGRHGAPGGPRRRGVAVRGVPELLRRRGQAGVPGGGLRSADRVRERRVPGAAGLRRRRPRLHAAAGPGAAHAASRPRRPPDQAARRRSGGSGRRPAPRAHAPRRPRRWSRSCARSVERFADQSALAIAA